MGFASCLSNCYGCKRVFMYNPMKVPSVTIDGVREPICEACVARVNPQRIANGLPPIVPMPDAYTACDENDMDWP